jgi:hypothetical protein
MFSWLKPDTKNSGKPRDILTVPDVYFWDVQDGDSERKLKAELGAMPVFKDLVSEAYLMRVRYPGATSEQVALCLVADKKNQREIVDEVEAAFRRMFKPSEYLDLLFLSEEQLCRASSISKAFFKRNE